MDYTSLDVWGLAETADEILCLAGYGRVRHNLLCTSNLKKRKNQVKSRHMHCERNESKLF